MYKLSTATQLSNQLTKSITEVPNSFFTSNEDTENRKFLSIFIISVYFLTSWNFLNASCAKSIYKVYRLKYYNIQAIYLAN